MRLAEAQKLVGRVVVLDLVNGTQACTRVEGVSLDGYLKAKQLIVYVAMPDPNNPQGVTMKPIEYGAPMYVAGKNTEIELSNILMWFDCPPGMEDSYNRHTGSISVAKPGLIIP